MPLPPFDKSSNMPPGVHQATLIEVVARFGAGSPQREEVTRRLHRVLGIAKSTGELERLVIFGSYVTAKPSPNDVDILLVMSDTFSMDSCTPEQLPIFDHMRAHDELGASVFWFRPSYAIFQSVDSFIAGFQKTREETMRGIVEVVL